MVALFNAFGSGFCAAAAMRAIELDSAGSAALLAVLAVANLALAWRNFVARHAG